MWSHQGGGDENNLVSTIGACKQEVARSSLFLNQWALQKYRDLVTTFCHQASIVRLRVFSTKEHACSLFQRGHQYSVAVQVVVAFAFF